VVVSCRVDSHATWLYGTIVRVSLTRSDIFFALGRGKLGIELAETVRPALVLLDIQLPLMDGYAVAQALRRNPALSATPTIVVTSYAMVGDRECALVAGCNGYLEKPVNPDTFLDDVAAFLE